MEEAYNQPRIRDYGTLTELTADFDVAFAGSVAKAVTLAAVSTPVGGLLPTDSVGLGSPSDGGLGGDVGRGAPAPGGEDGGGVLGDPESSPGDSGGSRGDALGDADGGFGGAASAPGASSAGKLAFTGLELMLVAGVGAALSTVGLRLRAALRRRP